MVKQDYILFITKHDPNSIGGGCYATHAFLRAFSVIFDGRIDICLADNCKPLKNDISYGHLYRVRKRSRLHQLFSFLTGDMHRYTSFIKHLLRKNAEKYTYCVFDQNAISGTLVKYVNKRGIKAIIIHHNHEPQYFSVNEKNKLVKFLLLPQIIRIEKIAYKNSNLNLFLTKDDLNTFESIYGKPTGANEIIGCFEYADYQTEKKTIRKINSRSLLLPGPLIVLKQKKVYNFSFPNYMKKFPSLIKLL